MIVLDTIVLSEVLRPAPAARVLAWLGSQEPLTIFTTTITQAEILYGVERLAAGKRRAMLVAAIESVFREDLPRSSWRGNRRGVRSLSGMRRLRRSR